MERRTVMATPFSIKCEILGLFYQLYKNEKEFAEFFQYNDYGLPTAYLVLYGLAEATDKGIRFVSDTYEILCGALQIDVDAEFANASEFFIAGGITIDDIPPQFRDL